MQEVKNEAVNTEAKEPKVIRKVVIEYKDDNTFSVNPVEVEGKTSTELEAFGDVEAVAELLKEQKESAKIIAQIQEYHKSLLEQILVPFNTRLSAVEKHCGLVTEEAPAEEAQ